MKEEFVSGARESQTRGGRLVRAAGIHESRGASVDASSKEATTLGKAFRARFRNGRIEPWIPLGFREEAELIVTAEEVGARRADAPEDIWEGYDPNAVDEALRETVGSWADINPDVLVAAIHRAREEGTRPPSGP